MRAGSAGHQKHRRLPNILRAVDNSRIWAIGECAMTYQGINPFSGELLKTVRSPSRENEVRTARRQLPGQF